MKAILKRLFEDFMYYLLSVSVLFIILSLIIPNSNNELSNCEELAEEYKRQRDSVAISSAEKSRDILFWERLDRNRGYKVPK